MTPDKSIEQRFLETIIQNVRHEVMKGGKMFIGQRAAALGCVHIHREECIKLLKWLSDKDSKYSIMYGGTPELPKDLRFADNDNDYTIDEIIDLYIASNEGNNEKE